MATNDLKWLSVAWRKPDRRPVHEWAREHVKLPPAVTLPGYFDVSRSRHLIEPIEALQSDFVREVSVLAPPRGGKSLISDVWVCWLIANDPGPTIVNFQKDDSAKSHCESRLMPALFACKPVAKYLDGLPKDKVRATEILFPHMHLIVQGPALTNLQSKGCRYLVNDEVWLYPAGRLAEAYGRVGDFVKMGTEKIFNLSQASEPDTDWHRVWKKTTQHEWQVQCEKCASYFMPSWGGKGDGGARRYMRWDEHRLANGDWDIQKVLPTIRFECPACGHPHMDTHRTKSEWNRTGRYVRTNADGRDSRRGYHWTAVIDYPWAKMVEEYLVACNEKRRGVIGGLVQFFQKYLAEFKSEVAVIADDSLMTVRRESEAVFPGEDVRFLTVDRQMDELYWAMIRAWAKDGSSRLIWFGNAVGGSAIEEIRKTHNVKPGCTFVDSGHEARGDFGVYDLCATYGWIATKGYGYHIFERADGRRGKVKSAYNDPVPVSSGMTSEKRAFLISFASDEMKDRVRRLIKIGKWLEPNNPEPEYVAQMNSEFKRAKVDKFTGKTQMVWVCPSKNNHLFDCAALQCLAATICSILPDIEGEKAAEEKER